MQALAQRHRGDQSAIRNREDLDDVIRKIGLVDLAMDANITDLNVALQGLKLKHLKEQQQLAADRNELLVRVQAYVQLHRDELLNGKAKTVRLNFGKAGWRKLKDKILGLPKQGTQGMEDLCQSIQVMKGMDDPGFREVYVRTQSFVLKNDLASLPEEALESLGLSKEPGQDEFFVEPDREKLRETGTGNGGGE